MLYSIGKDSSVLLHLVLKVFPDEPPFPLLHIDTTWKVKEIIEFRDEIVKELGNTNVAVVCAGCKSILDMGLTLEYLETKGVPVYGYQTNILPAFYTRESDFKVSKINSEEEIARVLKAKWDLELNGGVVIANPIPEEYSMDRNVIDKTILDALKEADENGIKGKDTTPFLLDKVQKLTQGKSLEANIRLVFNNAKLASKIAIEYSKLA